MRKSTLALCLVLGALAAGCSEDTRARRSEGTAGGHPQPAGTQGRPTGTPDQHRMMQGMIDADFVPMMIAHHEQGIEMARLEETHGASSEVKALATRIRQSQERELEELTAHAERVTGSRDASMTAHRDQMMDQQGRDSMDRLRSTSGEGLDRAFLQEMTRHHQMAIHMAQMTTFQDDELKKLSDRMVVDQQGELAELKSASAEGARAAEG